MLDNAHFPQPHFLSMHVAETMCMFAFKTLINKELDSYKSRRSVEVWER